MNKRRLGKSGLVVSEIGLGTMTFGSQNDERESFAIMDHALESGIDFFDTAELYPIPPKASWVHRTEEIVGKWLKARRRDEIILATKVAGPGHGWFSPPCARRSHRAGPRAHPSCDRGELAAPGYRLRGPLPDALARSRHAL